MSPFAPAGYPVEVMTPEFYMDRFKVGYDQACGMLQQQLSEKLFINDTYQVNVSDVHGTFGGAWPPMIHLAIKRIDKEPIHDWRAMQKIKNLMVGEENEAVEIYPAESRLVDMANQFHLWVFADPTVRIPIGWTTRMVADEVMANSVGAKQRPFEQERSKC